MKSLEKPAVDAVQHFRCCIGNTRDNDLQERLRKCDNFIANSAIVYEYVGSTRRFYTLTKISGAPATDKELEALYKQKMVQKGMPGRALYDELMHSAKGGICPFCAHRIVRTIDHYLPKSKFPTFAILPTNLVPACFDCNNDKNAYLPTTDEEQLLHPYFDRLDGQVWLRAYVEFSNDGPTVQFYVEAPSSWKSTLASRVSTHFEKLGLGTLYAVHGTKEISDIRKRLRSLLSAGGPIAVQGHLIEEWKSRAQEDPNSWKSATYHALANDQRFLDGNFGK